MQEEEEEEEVTAERVCHCHVIHERFLVDAVHRV
jgi:hypothetical protein